MSAYSIVSMRVQGHSAFALWVGDSVDPINPKGLIGARLLDTYPTKAAAESAAQDWAVAQWWENSE